ncbi:MAG: SPOR domain-containing protein [Idiomarina sp.]|nr:SPOR domain-containing protein [Idiomarina sp.]
MAVDYADKGKPKRKPVKRKAPEKRPSRNQHGKRRGGKQGPNRRPLGLVLVALLIVAMFVAALMWLKNNNEQDTGPDGPILFTDTTEQAPVAPPQATLDALPDAPQERWQYIEELENHSVEVIIPEREEARRRLMQCGSFRRESDAQELRARIAMAGYESQVRRTESAQHGAWFRVILGPFDGVRPAQTVNNQLRRNNIHGCQIWYWNLD